VRTLVSLLQRLFNKVARSFVGALQQHPELVKRVFIRSRWPASDYTVSMTRCVLFAISLPLMLPRSPGMCKSHTTRSGWFLDSMAWGAVTFQPPLMNGFT